MFLHFLESTLDVCLYEETYKGFASFLALDPTPQTLHPAPYALHTTPYTLHPTPQNHNALPSPTWCVFRENKS